MASFNKILKFYRNKYEVLYQYTPKMSCWRKYVNKHSCSKFGNHDSIDYQSTDHWNRAPYGHAIIRQQYLLWGTYVFFHCQYKCRSFGRPIIFTYVYTQVIHVLNRNWQILAKPNITFQRMHCCLSFCAFPFLCFENYWI